MEKEELISTDEFCYYHKIESTFIESLHESGLIEISIVDEKLFIPTSQLPNLEKFVRFYSEWNINLEGIEVINYLLERMNELQEKIQQLNNKLKFYE